MKTIKIEDKDYNVKDKIEELLVSEYTQILDIFSKEDTGLFQKLYYIILVISDIPEDVLDLVDEETFNGFNIDFINDLNEAMKSDDIPHKIEIDGVKYGYDTSDKRSIKQVIDINYFRFESDKGFSDLVHIAAIVMRPIIKEDGDYYEIEKYNTNKMFERVKKFENARAIDIYPTVNFFLTGSI